MRTDQRTVLEPIMLKIENIKKSYESRGGKIEVFTNFNLEIAEGECVTIFGPNGCGKTTLLNIMGNIVEPDSGKISFEGKPLNSLKIGYVFQDYRNSLLPWLKARDNIAFPLKLQKLPKSERDEIVKTLCKKFSCSFNLDAYPYQLSGGQQQYISLLRGLAIQPQIYLLDEPFSSLDYQTTLLMLEKMTDIWQKTKITTLFVSHEIDEAIFLARKIVLLGNKPTNVIKIFQNPLPYPRKINFMGKPEFANLKGEILEIYTQEIMRNNASSSII